MPRPLAKDVTRAALRWMAGGAVVTALLATLWAWADGAWADRAGLAPWLVRVMLLGLLGGVCGAVLGVVTRVVPPSASGMVLVALAAGLLSAPVGVAFGALLEPPGEALVMGLGLALGAGLIAVKELKVQKDALYDGVIAWHRHADAIRHVVDQVKGERLQLGTLEQELAASPVDHFRGQLRRSVGRDLGGCPDVFVEAYERARGSTEAALRVAQVSQDIVKTMEEWLAAASAEEVTNETERSIQQVHAELSGRIRDLQEVAASYGVDW